jgi:glutamate-1-semialdehyde 2,1-aminomutase/spore coat polysaccharide biosynthesis protein SpsF
MLAAVVQARMGSSRLPGKTMAPIEGKPMLQRFIERVRAARRVEEVIIATTTEPRDDAIADFARSQNLKCYRGSETDVLDRFFQAAQSFGVSDLVRVTSDCPLIDPAVIDRVIEAYRAGEYDYVSNTQGGRFPDGMDVEVFSFEALRRSHKEAVRPSEREHVTPHMKTSGGFRVGRVESPVDYSEYKWSVDNDRDLEFVREVYRRLGDRPFRMEEVLALVQRTPELAGLSRGFIVNEGYYRSIAKEPAVPPVPRSLDRSRALRERAEGLIPGEAQTFSKGPTQFVQGVAPAFVSRGEGCRLWDVDGNEYIDCTMALGAVVLGYADPDVDEAVRRQMTDGVSFSLPHPVEVQLAELLRELIPCAEMVRFGKNGSDVTAGAVRLARAATGREIILCCGYHGWQDWYIGTTTRNRGVPGAVRGLTVPFEYNNLDHLKSLFAQNLGKVAAVIMEPVGVTEPEAGFLRQVQETCKKEGALLVFDEVLTGVRFGLGGAGERFGVAPDLACFGKGLANGFPLSALVGRKEIMKQLEEVFFSFTFGGEAAALAAACATLEKLRRVNGVAHLWSEGQRLLDGTNVLARHFGLEAQIQCVGLAPRTVVQFQGRDEPESLRMKSLFQQECLKRGVLFTGAHLPSVSHTQKEVDQLLRVYRSALEEMAWALRAGDLAERLEGKPVQPVFRRA